MPGKRPNETFGRPIKEQSSLSMPAGFPGQLGLLAKQMNNGFGGGLLAQRQYLNQIYDPVQVSSLPQNLTPGGSTDTTATTTGSTGDSGDGFTLDPRMKRWESIFYNMPDGPARLRAMQEGFQRAGYL
ncbi:hypothetical protein [Shinella sp. JR1-6]|uniref:hypothetical protein n=1 Tax=Shinella sp. JR1-6 TaxID=2527671 RepID=UPI00102D674F|nr:hypothetical protein [Shinella sp. JR1-6]TAA51058.1 hypothetical protein EXZ48_32045 [Shinella sp. JR1-6]